MTDGHCHLSNAAASIFFLVHRGIPGTSLRRDQEHSPQRYAQGRVTDTCRPERSAAVSSQSQGPPGTPKNPFFRSLFFVLAEAKSDVPESNPLNPVDPINPVTA